VAKVLCVLYPDPVGAIRPYTPATASLFCLLGCGQLAGTGTASYCVNGINSTGSSGR
jgi:hypothetical protein